MNAAGAISPGVPKGRRWAYGAGLTALGAVLVVWPAAEGLRASMRDLARAQSTLDAKLRFVANGNVVRRRLAESRERLRALEEQIVTDKGLAGVTRTLALAARATGCSVLSTRPASARVIPRPGGEASRPRDKGKKARARPDFVEWRTRATVRGEYAQLVALLERLSSEQRRFRATRLVAHPSGDDRINVLCELEIAGYGLRPPPGGHADE